MQKKGLAGAFSEFVESRIVEIEAARSSQTDLREVLKKMDSMEREIKSKLPEAALFNEFLMQQHEFISELYHAIYCQAFSDAMCKIKANA